jgi:hypothetical protein
VLLQKSMGNGISSTHTKNKAYFAPHTKTDTPSFVYILGRVILFKKSPKMYPSSFFAKINTELFPWKKDAQQAGLMMPFSKILPKENNYPIG